MGRDTRTLPARTQEIAQKDIRMSELKDGEELSEMLSSRDSRIIGLMLRLLKQDLEKTEPINIPAWMGRDPGGSTFPWRAMGS